MKLPTNSSTLLQVFSEEKSFVASLLSLVRYFISKNVIDRETRDLPEAHLEKQSSYNLASTAVLSALDSKFLFCKAYMAR